MKKSFSSRKIGWIIGKSKNIKMKSPVKPKLSIWSMIRWRGSGAKAKRTREPSSGGKGIKLNTKKPIFIWSMITKASRNKPSPGINRRYTSPVATARRRFARGPAIAIKATPNSAYLTRCGLNGTGLAAPNGGRPNNISISGSPIVIRGSMWRSGLIEIRPARLAVSSPRESPTKACIISWKAIENAKAGTAKSISFISMSIYPLYQPRTPHQLACSHAEHLTPQASWPVSVCPVQYSHRRTLVRLVPCFLVAPKLAQVWNPWELTNLLCYGRLCICY